MTPMDHFALWQRTLADQADSLSPQREILRQAFLLFRERTAQLVGEIGGLLPQLTVHDITHLDALWRVADEIAGPDYPLNPAEAFVLGGAFLLHDAAHVLAAYEDGLAGIKDSIEWKDLIAQRFEDNEPVDPIIYMITAALGFVALENALFIFGPLIGEDVTRSIITGNLRFIGASLLHVASSSIIGVSLAFSFYKSRSRRTTLVILALILAVVFHTGFNLAILYWSNSGAMLAFSAVWISIVVLLLVFERVKAIAR